mmetsp:Transcript_30484/g.94412  ORF Transcript_30484/g.94412 Transcript_30484/m.94412 type:complete len:92 (-) Transcript_30484:164-439(-)
MMSCGGRLLYIWLGAAAATPDDANPFSAGGFKACSRLAERTTRRTASPRIVDDGHACLDALEASRPDGEKLGREYYDVVPLVETRTLQALA